MELLDIRKATGGGGGVGGYWKSYCSKNHSFRNENEIVSENVRGKVYEYGFQR